jgi:Xaa-Pro aminopeptidase
LNVPAIQEALREDGLDGWLFFDHHVRDPLAYRVLGLPANMHVTRRWYYFIPAFGEPRKLAHRIEPGHLDSLPGAKTIYSSWDTQRAGLAALLGGARRVAMQYSPECAIPYVAMVDAGTVELVRGMNVEVFSSANLIQLFEARWTAAQLEMHLDAGRRVDRVRREAFERIAAQQRGGERIGEYDVQQFIMRRFQEEGMVTDSPPIVAVNANASNPHYSPDAAANVEIRKNDAVLIDMWAKLDKPDAVFYDITWTGYCGTNPPDKLVNMFDAGMGARDAAIAVVRFASEANQPLCGYEVDDACRGYMQSRGYAEYFVHRTGHSIGIEVHGAGANMDNLETHDVRRVIPWTCFSIEPGIYMEDYGIRTEVNMFVGEREARVTGEMQEKLLEIV